MKKFLTILAVTGCLGTGSLFAGPGITIEFDFIVPGTVPEPAPTPDDVDYWG